MEHQSPFGLYIHIPFCHHKCPYCDFNTYAPPRFPEQEYVQALCDELSLRAQDERWIAHPLRSVFFGGGTPSIFSSKSLALVLETIRRDLRLQEGAEITLEANPVGLKQGYFEEIRAAGIHRLSFGVQSFQAPTLKMLGRNHGPQDIFDAYEMARRAGFTNISLDILYASPGQERVDFEKDLAQGIAMQPEHISSYLLSLEPGTPYYQAHEKGSISLPSEEISLAMMDALEDMLAQAGFEQYEISNFAKPGFRSAHNWGYWEGEDYLGLGAGAHSYRSDDVLRLHTGKRWSNLALPQSYIEKVSKGEMPEAWSENLDMAARQYEFFFLGLRKIQGVQKSEFERRFKVSLEENFEDILLLLAEAKLLVQDGDNIFLTRTGRRVSDSVFGEFARNAML